MKSSTWKWCISLAFVLCIALAAGSAFAQQGQGLSAVGFTNPAHGYPKWYQDGHGLRLEPCLDNNANDPCGLVAALALPNPAAPVVFPTNFPDEFFYMRATSRIAGIGGGTFRADLILAVEGAFGGPTGTVADGNGAQITFSRYRFKVTGGLVPGATYTVTAPFGSRSFVAASTGTVIFTSQQGCAAVPPACDFTLAMATPEVGPFLQWDPLASGPPAGYIGQPAIPHAIIGSPVGTNLFRISGPNVGGPGVNVVETNLFNVRGKIFVPPATSTSLTSTPNPSVTGQTITLTAKVAPVTPAPEALNGTVTFRDGATSLGVVTLVNGSASLTISTLAVGSHSLTAAYSGSPDFAPSTSAVVTQTVNKGSTSTSLTSAPNPSTAGQAVTLSSTVRAVAPATGVPTGTVTFSDGATVLGTATLVNGSASLPVSTLALGSHSLASIYSGSANFLASTSPTVTQTVSARTTTSLASTPNPSVTGQAVTLSATVSPVAPATGVPTGTVTFKDGATVLGTAALVNGSASLSATTLAVGAHSLTATYNGAGNFLASTSAAVIQTVNQGNTSTSLASTPNPSNAGQTVTLAAKVSATALATGVPTGTVTFRDGTTVLGTATLVNGSASFSISTLAVGSHSLTAAYGGSAAFASSTSAVVTHVVVNARAAVATSTRLSSTPNPSTFGRAVNLSSTVTSAAGVPAGTVTFRDSATVLGTVTLVNGNASLSASRLAAGTHLLTATYNGSATFASSTSPTVNQVVNAADSVTIKRAEQLLNTGELRANGVNRRIPGDGFAASVEIHSGAAVGGTCPGALIGTTSVNTANGTWRFSGITGLRPTTVCVKSAGGGVASRAVTPK